jgi:hypothetical protein
MLENLKPRETTHVAKIDQILNDLDTDDRKLFTGFLADVNSWSPNELSFALSEHGISVAGDTIRRYRRKHGFC